MEETLINFVTANLAKKKGFNVEVERYVSDINGHSPNMGLQDFNLKNIGGLCSAPTQGLLKNWLWEVHKLFVTVSGSFYIRSGEGPKCDGFTCYINDMNVGNTESFPKIGEKLYMCPKQALEKGLQEALKLIK